MVLDFVGTDQTMQLGALVARADGEVSVVGLAGGTLPFTAAGSAGIWCGV